MLENIALSISTLVFLLCNLVVNSMVPAVPSETVAPDQTIECHEVIAVDTEAETLESFTLAGVWNSSGRMFEFTSSGNLLYNGRAMPYEVNGNVMTVTTEVGGELRTHTLNYEPINDRVIKLNGVTLYRLNR